MPMDALFFKPPDLFTCSCRATKKEHLEISDNSLELSTLFFLIYDRNQRNIEFTQFCSQHLAELLLYFGSTSLHNQSRNEPLYPCPIGSDGNTSGGKQARKVGHPQIDLYLLERFTLYRLRIFAKCHQHTRDNGRSRALARQGSFFECGKSFVKQIRNRSQPRQRSISDLTGSFKCLLAQCGDN